MNLSERIAADGITCHAVWLDRPPKWARDRGTIARWWTVTLRMPHAPLFTAPFGQGPAWTTEPTAVEVLECVLGDMASYENAGSLEEWARDEGADPDEAGAQATYRRIEAQRRKLQAFLGARYDAYLWETDRG
jgi:hypothetical protein